MTEIFEVSQLEPSGIDDKGTTFGAQSASGSGGSWLIAIFCLFLLLVLVSASIFIFSSDVGSAEKADDAPPASGGDGSPGPSAPSGPSGTHSRKNKGVTVVTVAPSPKTHEQGNIITGQHKSGGTTVTAVRPEGRTPATTQTPAPTTTERTKKPNPGRSRQPKLFVCYTVPQTLSAGFDMPDDLCDVVLIGIDCYGPWINEPETIVWSYKWLFNMPSKYHKTKFGFVTCVMNYDEVFADIANHEFFQMLSKVPLHYYGIGILKQLWRSPILGSVDVNAPFVYVKRIRDMFWPTAKIVYKVEFDSKKNIDYFIDMCRNTQMPDLIVVTAHDYFPGPDVKKQVLLPPNIYYRPIDFWYQANYGHTVPEAMAEALTVLNNGVSRPISLVLTMAGTKARMQYPDIRNPKAGRCAIYQPAVNEYRSSWHTHLTNPKAMCSGKAYEAYRANLQYQENALTWLAFNKTLNVSTSMAFDTAETLRDKICNVFVNHTDDDLTQKIDFGISELAWDRDPCDLPSWKSPPYERVRMVRAVSKFLTDEYWDPTDLYFCLKVKP